MINKYANRLDVLFKYKSHSVNINKHEKNIFWGEKFFWKETNKAEFDLLKKLLNE